MKKQFISWRRVSTFKQSRSGLGLEAQKEIIRYFVERDGGEIIADYAECYTGKELSGCKELRKAMTKAKETGAILVIAKSDRFRNCQEALGILDEMGEGNIEFCDLPHSDRFTLTLFWALAEREALITSIRTKQALAVKKSNGAKLGAACDKYKETKNKKTIEERKQEEMERGLCKKKRHQESRDVQAFIRVLRNVFNLDGDPASWDWSIINTKGDKKDALLRMMRDYNEMDGNVFRSWDFTNERKSTTKLRSYLQATRISFINN